MAELSQNSLSESTVLASSLEAESDELWKANRPIALFTLMLPAIAIVTAAVLAFIWGGPLLVRQLSIAVLASLAAGRFIIWTGTAADAAIGFSPLQLVVMVLILDIIWAVVLTWHAGVLFRLPWIGSHLKSAVQETGDLLRCNRWMKRITLLAVLGFVMLPVSSTGSIGGSLLGRLLGLNRTATFLTVLVGSVAGGAIMLIFAQNLAPWFDRHGPTVQYGVIGLLILVGAFITRRYRSSLSNGSESAGQLSSRHEA